VIIKENSVGGHCPIQVCKWKVESLKINKEVAIQEIIDHMISVHHFPERLAHGKAEERVSD